MAYHQSQLDKRNAEFIREPERNSIRDNKRSLVSREWDKTTDHAILHQDESSHLGAEWNLVINSYTCRRLSEWSLTQNEVDPMMQFRWK